MIIRIQPSGGSFRGAGQYYLHDKADDKDLAKELKPKTDERVWFTATRNCANFDSAKALDEMWHVAESQQQLKALAGGRTSGRSCGDPVKTISLSWHKDDQPTPDHMVEAADSYLKHMGWERFQVVMVGHRDTEHLHLHLVLNRVSPENGRTLDDWRDQPRSQAWALEYEKEMETLRCIEREVRAAEREKRTPEFENAAAAPDRAPANEHMPYNVVELMRPLEKQHCAEERALVDTSLEDERLTLKAEQRQEREAWFKDGARMMRELRHAIYDEVSKEQRQAWAHYYAQEKEAMKQAEALSGDALLRAQHFARDGQWQNVEAALTDVGAVRRDTEERLFEQYDALRKGLREELRDRQKEACDALLEERKAQYAELLARQRDERAAMRAAHAQGHSAAPVLEAREQRRDTVEKAAETANDNRQQQEVQPELGPPRDMSVLLAATVREAAKTATPLVSEAVQEQHSTQLSEPSPPVNRDPGPEPVKSGADLLAGGIGAAANYLADQLAELFAPTPPEVREARAKQEAKREAEKPREEFPALTPFQRHMEEVLRAADRHVEEKRTREYWDDRDKKKEYERDR